MINDMRRKTRTLRKKKFFANKSAETNKMQKQSTTCIESIFVLSNALISVQP